MLPRKIRLRAREDFDRVFRQGKTLFFGEILCLWRKNDTQETRIGVAFKGKVFRRAATKHLYKRKTMEALRHQLSLLPSGLDLILLFQKKLPGEKFTLFEERVKQLFRELNKVKK